MEETQKQPQPTSGNSKTKYFVIIGVVVILLIAAFVFASRNKQNQEVVVTPKETEPTAAPLPTTTSISTTEASLTAEPAPPTLKDGTYTADGPYTVHIGEKTIKVTITLKDNIITESEVVNMADDPTSKRFQDIFIAEYKPLVEGKDIRTLNLTKVASSSLTPQGFNVALRAIEQQAQL